MDALTNYGHYGPLLGGSSPSEYLISTVIEPIKAAPSILRRPIAAAGLLPGAGQRH